MSYSILVKDLIAASDKLMPAPICNGHRADCGVLKRDRSAFVFAWLCFRYPACSAISAVTGRQTRLFIKVRVAFSS